MPISQFQLTLVAAGAAGVAAVWGYNLWQERRARKAAEKVFRGAQSDVLLDGVEPEREMDVHAAEPSATTVGNDPSPERREPRIEPVVADAPDDSPAPPQPDKTLADADTEMAVAVSFGDAPSGRSLWQAMQELPIRILRRLRWIGFTDGGWREIDIDDDSRYPHAQALLQLADRQGAMGGDELAVFVAAVDNLARAAGGSASAPMLSDVAAHARALDEFCAGMDIQMAVHVVSRSGNGFAGTKLRSLMEAAGFELRSDGLFHLADEAGNTTLSVSNFGAAPFVADELKTLVTQGVTFWLDVPRVSNGVAVFDRLVSTARQLAGAVDGELVDDQRRTLEDGSLTGIRAKIGEIQQKMAAAELPAGGRRALRLFR